MEKYSLWLNNRHLENMKYNTYNNIQSHLTEVHVSIWGIWLTPLPKGCSCLSQTNSLITLQNAISLCQSAKLFTFAFDVYLSINKLKLAMTAAAPHQLAKTDYHDVQCWACSKEKIQQEVNEEEKTRRQSASLKNDICWCWPTFSPPGNILVFQENKFKDQSGKVRQIPEGAISKMRKGQRNIITLVDIAQDGKSQISLPTFYAIPAHHVSAALPSEIMAALTQGHVWKKSLLKAAMSSVSPVLPLWKQYFVIQHIYISGQWEGNNKDQCLHNQTYDTIQYIVYRIQCQEQAKIIAHKDK